jgi:saccharopine dehydrogenase-like NADP-dependent oxidoreductase
MKAVVLGCAGAMGVHASSELIASGLFDQILVADLDVEKARQMAGKWGLPDEAVACLDASDQTVLRQMLAGNPDVVVNALPKGLALPVAEAVIATGARAIDLGDISPELLALSQAAHAAGAVYVSGCGSSSGLTNMLAKHGARGMDEIGSIEIDFASYRSIALSPASVDGVFWEFGPDVRRGYYAEGAYREVRLWDGAKTVDFPEPIGRQTVYIVPQSEAHTLPRTLGAKAVTVRGTFTPKAMQLMRSLCEYGAFDPAPVTINGSPIPRRELVKQYLVQTPQANEESAWGYALHVQVTGRSGDRALERTLWTRHPSAEQAGWSGPSAWTRCVALPLVAGALLLARGNFRGTGIDAPEAFLPSEPFLSELALRGIQVHETERDL